MKNSLELIKSSESVIDRIVSVKKSDDSGGAVGGRSQAGDGGGAESDSDADGMSSDGEFGASNSSKPGGGSSSAKSALKKSKKLKTKLGRTIKNVRKIFFNFFFFLNSFQSIWHNFFARLCICESWGRFKNSTKKSTRVLDESKKYCNLKDFFLTVCF